MIVSTRPVARFAVLGALALSVSACSQTDRFAYDPFKNPFNGRETTGSVDAAPSGSVSSQPLPPPSGYQPSSYTPSNNYQQPAAYAPQQQAYAPYQQPKSYPQPSAQPSPSAQFKYSTQSGWNAHGGKTVVVKAGDTPYGLGTQHGVPASAILQANNLPAGSALTPGQRLVIPSYNGQKTAAKPAPAVAQAPKAAPAKAGGTHVVKPGETLFSIARTYNVPPRELADANSVGMDHRVQIGERVSLPGGTRMAAATSRPVQVASIAPETVKPAVYKPQEEALPVKAEPARAVAKLDDDADDFASKSPATQATGGSDFRWPVRGRVISGFGSKPNGQTNDGINISVPEGTEIKAAEGGVVAYAGNELKGFGNLILIRHSGDWVTAYAHASDISVKRGDVVRRGQVIGKSGKTGNVSSPQLHFEVRRGASPVDPMTYLPQG